MRFSRVVESRTPSIRFPFSFSYYNSHILLWPKRIWLILHIRLSSRKKNTIEFVHVQSTLCLQSHQRSTRPLPIWVAIVPQVFRSLLFTVWKLWDLFSVRTCTSDQMHLINYETAAKFPAILSSQFIVDSTK